MIATPADFFGLLRITSAAGIGIALLLCLGFELCRQAGLLDQPRQYDRATNHNRDAKAANHDLDEGRRDEAEEGEDGHVSRRQSADEEREDDGYPSDGATAQDRAPVF